MHKCTVTEQQSDNKKTIHKTANSNNE